jgi:2-keto-4-pentenoate hydratase/2-oxohepta-3-ene-1,7-dioic acid hydratase in catechol pathway
MKIQEYMHGGRLRMEEGYRLVTYAVGQGPVGQSAPQAGILAAGRVLELRHILGESFSSTLDVLRSWDTAHQQIAAAIGKGAGEQGTPEQEVNMLAPVQFPGAFFCAGANYWDHLEEMAEIAKRTTGKAPSMTKAAEPWFFMKTAAGSIVGNGAPVRLPSFSRQVDWEAELGVVIGRPTRRISERDALEAVAGYLIVNDLSARDLMKREGTPFIYDWLGQKCFEDAAPMGPWLTPAAYIPDPNNLGIRLWVNGVLKQNSNTGRMVHSIAEQIAYLSRHLTLQPGDVIATGTPAGVGMPRGEFLQPGDEVAIEIDGLGRLVNRMVADAG